MIGRRNSDRVDLVAQLIEHFPPIGKSTGRGEGSVISGAGATGTGGTLLAGSEIWVAALETSLFNGFDSSSERFVTGMAFDRFETIANAKSPVRVIAIERPMTARRAQGCREWWIGFAMKTVCPQASQSAIRSVVIRIT
jgi:hypothetical protein